MEAQIRVEHLLKAISRTGSVGSDLGEDGRNRKPTEDDSIFSHLVERLVQGRGLRLGNGEAGAMSLEILLENAPDPVLLLTQNGEITEVNPAFCAVYGYTRSELIGNTIFSFIPERYCAGFVEKLATFGGEGTVSPAPSDDILAFRGLKADGSIVTMDCLLSPVFFDDGPKIIAVIRDLSTDKELFEQLKESKDHYIALSETIVEAIFRLDSDFRILYVNSGVKNTFGFDPEEVMGKSLMTLFPEEVFRKHEPEFRKYFVVDDQDRSAFGLKRTVELLGQTKNRGVAPMEMSFGNSKEFRGRTLTCIVRDVTYRKIMERRLRHLAYHDKLTGLGNRDLFNEDMKSLLREPSWTRGRRSGVMFLDLDGFKHINDTLGHEAGDTLLVEVARRIRVCLRDIDSPYRFGGDEFVVLLREMNAVADARLVAERILRSIKSPYWILRNDKEKARVVIGVSIGVAVMPDHGETAEAATKCADIAMYYSKETGKNRVTIYDDALKTHSMQAWNVDQEVQSALLSGQFQLHYQPIVTPSGHLIGMEALLRWTRDGVEVMSPGSFIPIAEENGVIIPLGKWILHRAFADLMRLQRRGLHHLKMAVNVSTKQFEHPNFVGDLTDAIAGSHIDSANVILEIIETTLMRNPEEAVAKINAIKKRFPQLMLAIDDFGTGYSSLSYLSRLPVDILKIDKSFVRALEREQNRKVVNAILNLATSLGIRVVAEGIETSAQHRYFKERKCYGIQGFLFMRPVSLPELFSELKRLTLKGDLIAAP